MYTNIKGYNYKCRHKSHNSHKIWWPIDHRSFLQTLCSWKLGTNKWSNLGLWIMFQLSLGQPHHGEIIQSFNIIEPRLPRFFLVYGWFGGFYLLFCSFQQAAWPTTCSTGSPLELKAYPHHRRSPLRIISPSLPSTSPWLLLGAIGLWPLGVAHADGTTGNKPKRRTNSDHKTGRFIRSSSFTEN